MPKVSRESAEHVDDHGIVEDRYEDVEDTTISFVSFRGDADHAPFLKGLPDDRCQCPHWGYVLTGRLTVRYANGVDTLEAGDAFYLPPGHVPSAAAGTEIVMFSPAEQLKATEEVVMRNAQAMMGA